MEGESPTLINNKTFEYANLILLGPGRWQMKYVEYNEKL